MNKQRRKVLVLQHPDGYLQVFGDKDIDVKVLSIFDEIDYDMGTEDEQIETLPLVYQYLHRADRIRATAMMRKTPKKRPSLWELLRQFTYHKEQFQKRIDRNENKQEAHQGDRAPDSLGAAREAARTRPSTSQGPRTACATT